MCSSGVGQTVSTAQVTGLVSVMSGLAGNYKHHGSFWVGLRQIINAIELALAVPNTQVRYSPSVVVLLLVRKSSSLVSLPQVWTGLSHTMHTFQLNWLFQSEPSADGTLVSNGRLFFLSTSLKSFSWKWFFHHFASLYGLDKGYDI